MQIFLLGILAGVYIGFGALLMMCVGGSCTGIAGTDPGLKAIISGLFGLPFGLIMVLVTGSELFTGNAALVTTAVLEGRATMAQLTKSWVVSFTGNIVGSIALASLAVFAGLFTTNPVAIKTAVAKTSLSWGAVRIPPPSHQHQGLHTWHTQRVAHCTSAVSVATVHACSCGLAVTDSA